MKRPFSFMSGEWKVSMPAVFSMKNWQHTCTAERLVEKNGGLYRTSRLDEPLKGVILYADIENKDIERSNIRLVIKHSLPCWPNPQALLRMVNRFDVMKECAENDFFKHEIIFGTIDPNCDPEQSRQIFEKQVPHIIPQPYVVKMGNLHRGEGKFLIENGVPFPQVISEFSVEPYFKGESVRALVIGDDIFGIRVTNDETWIKNSAGAEIHEFKLSDELIKHARLVTKHFKLDVSGVDYIVQTDGTFHFLEINQYPGFAGFDNVIDCAKEFLKKKMNQIEDKRDENYLKNS